jgi:hypothetical protein
VIGIALPQQNLELTGRHMRMLFIGPPFQLPAGKSSVAQPKSRPIKDQNLQSGSRPVPEKEDCTTEGIGIEKTTAFRCQAIDTTSKINRLSGCIDAHLGDDL